MEHSKTPWNDICFEIDMIADQPYLVINNKAMEKGDLAHIVKCVNNHKALVEALKDMTELASSDDYRDFAANESKYEKAQQLLKELGE